MGEALALQIAGAGFRVAVASRNPDKVAASCDKVREKGGVVLALVLVKFLYRNRLWLFNDRE